MKYLLLALICSPFIGFAQKIKVNEFDKFIKQRHIETTPVVLKAGGTEGMSVAFKSNGTNFTALLTGYGSGASTISTDDQTIFLLDGGDSTVVINSTGIQAYDLGVGNKQNTYKHEYRISLGGLEMLSRHNVKSVRKYTFKGFVNLDVPSKNADALKKLSTVFLNELRKEKVLYTQTVALEEIKMHVGDSITVCGKIFTGRYLENVDRKPTLLNMGAAYPNQLLTLVIYEDSRTGFERNPESAYRDKEVCVTGRVELYQGKPQIILRSPDQLMVKN